MSYKLFLCGLLMTFALPAWAGSVTLLPASIAFGKQTVGTISAAKRATLTNAQAVSLKIRSINVPAGFVQTNNCGTRLAPMSACTILVRFEPTQAKKYGGGNGTFLGEYDNGP